MFSTPSNIFSVKSSDSNGDKKDEKKPAGGSVFGSTGSNIFNFTAGIPPVKKGEPGKFED